MSERRVGIAAGVIAALAVVVAFAATDSFGRVGGLHMVWTPPAGYDVQRLRSRPTPDGERVEIRDGAVTLEVAGVAPSDVEEVARRVATQPFEVHEVLETSEMMRLPRVVQLPMANRWPADFAIDQWRSGGLQRSDLYLRGDRAAVEAVLAEAAAAGWKLPPGARVVYEPIDDARGAAWRTYVVSDRVEVDGDDVATVAAEGDARVAVVLTPGASERFAALTTRLVGHKLATTFGDEVRSAPILGAPITAGALAIAVGSDRERDVMIDVLRAGTLPPGGRVEAATYAPPADAVLAPWLARLAWALLAGLAVGAAAFAARRAATRTTSS